MKAQMTTILSTLLLSFALSASVAGAADYKIDASDLDLRKPADAEVLYERIKHAARMVCKAEGGPWDPQSVKTYNSCKTALIEDTIVRFNQPLLTAVHRGTIKSVAAN